jgi:hypothetical protein
LHDFLKNHFFQKKSKKKVKIFGKKNPFFRKKNPKKSKKNPCGFFAFTIFIVKHKLKKPIYCMTKKYLQKGIFKKMKIILSTCKKKKSCK